MARVKRRRGRESMRLPRKPSAEARRARGLRWLRAWVALRLQERRRGRLGGGGLAAPTAGDWSLEQVAGVVYVHLLAASPPAHWGLRGRLVGEEDWGSFDVQTLGSSQRDIEAGTLGVDDAAEFQMRWGASTFPDAAWSAWSGTKQVVFV